MGKCNFLFFINAYADLSQTTTPALSNFKWSREINGVPFNFENSQQFQVSTSTTTANILPFSFLTLAATTIGNINATTNLTLTGSTTGVIPGLLVVGAGIPVNTTVVSVGTSQYTFTVTTANATSGDIYSNNGQTFTVTGTIVAGTTLVANGTGAPTASGTLTKVSGSGDATITFSSSTVATVVVMSNAATTTAVGESVSFYVPASFIYLESDQKVSVIYNGGTPVVLNPLQVNGLTQPATFFIAGPATSLTVTNLSTSTANVFFASMG